MSNLFDGKNKIFSTITGRKSYISAKTDQRIKLHEKY